MEETRGLTQQVGRGSSRTLAMESVPPPAPPGRALSAVVCALQATRGRPGEAPVSSKTPAPVLGTNYHQNVWEGGGWAPASRPDVRVLTPRAHANTWGLRRVRCHPPLWEHRPSRGHCLPRRKQAPGTGAAAHSPVEVPVLALGHLDPSSLLEVVDEHRLLDISDPLHLSCHDPGRDRSSRL